MVSSFVGIVFCEDGSIFSMLQQEYIQKVSQVNVKHGQVLVKAFKSYHCMAKNCKPTILLKNESICKLFFLTNAKSWRDQDVVDIQAAQQLMLMFLYGKIFQDCIVQAEQFVEELYQSLNYWKVEMFYESLSMRRKHPVYWYHSIAYKKTVKLHVKALSAVEKEITHILGLALYGQHELSKIISDQNMSQYLELSMQPLHQYFNILKNEQVNFTELFQNTVWLQEQIDSQFQQCRNSLVQHHKPHHIIQHAFLYGCITVGVLAAYFAYKAHQDQVPECLSKGKNAWEYFIMEYIKKPITGLKEVLWDKKGLEYKELEPPTPISEVSLPSIPDINLPQAPLIGDAYAPGVGTRIKVIENFGNEFIVKIDEKTNNGVRFINDGSLKWTKWINENVKNLYGDLLKNQQVNFHLAAIGPVLIASYFLYKGCFGLYHQYVTHDSWHKPMKLLIREIDQILNKLIFQQGRSYADDGALYLLILRFKSYVFCLSNEELQLIYEDIQQLLAYDLSYEQKHYIIKRMYHVYDFLR